MKKPALGILLSTLFLVFSNSTQAKIASTAEAASKQPSSKQTAATKRKVTKKHSRKASRKVSKTSHVAKAKSNAGLQRVAYSPAAQAVPPVFTAGDLAKLHLTHDPLALKSNVALVVDQSTAQVLFEKNGNVPLPIASITKLMTAMVVVESQQPMNEVLEVTAEDVDHERNSGSRLRVGSRMTRGDMLHIALMSSENRAASALGRNYPGGLPAFVAAMNAKAKTLGMNDTRYVDSTGLSSQNVASARDLAKLVVAAYGHPVIREYSTDPEYTVRSQRGSLHYINSNSLVRSSTWDIGLQKTGYITEAGRCLVMQTKIEGRPVVMVFLDSKGKLSRVGDAGRIRKWLEMEKPQVLTSAAGRQG